MLLHRGQVPKLGDGHDYTDEQVWDYEKHIAEAAGVKATTEIPERHEKLIAKWFAAEHTDDLRYVATWKAWHWWDGAVWAKDDTLRATYLAGEACKVLASMEETENKKAYLLRAATIAAVERLARAEPPLVATPEQFDADPWLLNTPSGVVDLRAWPGGGGSNRPDAYMTKITAVALANDDHPRWSAVLNRALPDPEIRTFLQRFAGYCLTGDVSHHALMFAYGTGGNGKGIVINTMRSIMGTYAKAAASETFMETHNDRHPTELAYLMGARLVTASETEKGRRWAQARIAQLTGGDPISARFMRGDLFEFMPQFKLILAGNYRPQIRGVNEAIRRRLHLVHFAVTIPEEERDPDLFDKLKPEWPAILRWMMDGCVMYRERGLAPPAAVRATTASYLEAEDAVSQWIEEECEFDPQAWSSSKELFKAWSSWAHSAGEPIGSRKALAYALQERGIEPKMNTTRTARGFAGIRIKLTFPDD